MKCEHEWGVDKAFESGEVVMLFGSLDELSRELRYVCKKCKAVKYE